MNSPAPAAPKKRSPILFVILGVLIAGVLFGLYRYWQRPTFTPSVPHLGIDLRAPDMLLATRNLAELPKDVADAPLLAGLVDEQLVFHYEEDDARLSLEGSLRRLAYEHNLELQDRFLATLLAAPAEVAMWRTGKGRPELFIAKLERGVLAKLTEALAKIVLDDKQLQQAGTFTFGSDKVTLYTLAYGNGRTLGFAGLGDHWVFLSDPKIVLTDEGSLSADANGVLNDLLHGKQPWKEALPAPQSAKHSFVLSQQAVTMEYGRFLSGLAGARFDYQEKGWQPSLRLAPMKTASGTVSSYDTAPIWRTLPIGAAFCTALPVNWTAVGAPLETLLGKNENLAPTLAALDPVAAACWYPDSRLSAPLFIARAARDLPPQAGELLAKLAERAWSESAEKIPASNGGGEMLTATVPSDHGLRASRGDDRAFRVTLAQNGKLIFFSPNQPQVEAALAVATKRMAALGDETGLQGEAWAMLDPAQLTKLVRAEVQNVLPADEESFFREVARNRLWPRLEAWGKQNAFVLQPAKADDDGFVALEIKPLKGQKP